MTGNEQAVDVVVIGLGPGGEEVASRLADAGLTVVGVERELVGGECPYWGCIPSKMIVRGAETLAEARRVDRLAGAAQVYADYAPVARRIRAQATDDWDDTVAVQRFEKHGGRFVRGQAMLEGPRRVRVGETVFTASLAVVAVGRRPDLRGVGLASVGLDESAHAVAVDDRMRAADGLWAIGDVTCVGAFTHLAVYQARIAADDILGVPGFTADYTALPRVTFTDPEIASVGLSEAAARAAGIDLRTGRAPVPASSRGFIHGPGNNGLIKLVCDIGHGDAGRGVLVGATSVGPRGGEVLSMLTLAVHARLPVSTLYQMIYAFPTFHRGVLDALADLPV